MRGVLGLAHTNVPPKISPFKVCSRVFVLNGFSIKYQALVCVSLNEVHAIPRLLSKDCVGLLNDRLCN